MNTKPHIVKFSGGRSSGMVLMNLLENQQLDPKRGDVIVFNNTSAEHSKTYEFTSKMKTLAEEKYNIPFFWIEYQTYEDANKTRTWARKPSYRLVNDKPFSKQNPNGYRYKGEVFEEMISLGGYLPSMVSRVCTVAMKIFTTNAFLTNWFAHKSSIEKQGHFGKTSRITDKDVIDKHRKFRGTVPDDILLIKKQYVRNSTFVREKQNWRDYTKADIVIDNPVLKQSTPSGKITLYGHNAIDYVSVLGIRSDEKRRLVKIEKRIDEAQDSRSRSLFSQPLGEEILAPLVDENIDEKQVREFWSKQSFNLDLPANGLFSNCLYCPLKGKARLQQIALMQLNEKIDTNTPESIEWWVNIEKKYSRDLKAENREVKSKGTKYVGFFGGVGNFVFEDIKNKAQKGEQVDPELLKLDTSMACNCTD